MGFIGPFMFAAYLDRISTEEKETCNLGLKNIFVNDSTRLLFMQPVYKALAVLDIHHF